MDRFARLCAYAVLFTCAGVVGRATVVDGATLALVWPAGGVAVLWLLGGGWRERLPDAIALGACTLAFNSLSGASLSLSAVFVVVNLAQAVTVVALLRRWLPQLYGVSGHDGPDRTIETPGDLLWFMLAAAGGAAVNVVVGNLLLAPLGRAPGLAADALWWGRNATGILVVAVTGHLLLHAYRQRRGGGAAVHATVPTPRRAIETVGLLTVSVATFGLCFAQSTMPLAFMPLLATFWVGVRYGRLCAAVHGALGSATLTFFTVTGHGPFSLVDSPQERALLTQTLVTIVMCVGLSLALVRHVNDRLVADLHRREEEQRLTVARSRQQAYLMYAVTETIGEAIVVLDADGDVWLQNTHASELQSTAEPDDSWPDGGELRSWRAVFDAARDGLLEAPRDLTVRVGEEPQVRALEARQLASTDTNRGVAPRTVLTLRDVTHERQHRDELASFAGVVAHDLRNPIGVVKGWAQELRLQVTEESPTTDDLLGIGRAIDRAADRMNELVEDLLTHAMSRDRVLDPVAVDLGSLVAEIAAARGIDRSVVVRGTAEASADRALLRQVLDNLLGNAVKYVAPGVSARVEVHTVESDGMVEVSVADNGLGVPHEHRERVFQQFQRAHTDYPGTGLGLAICRTIVERHGGRIGVEPGPGGTGSRFWFTLPAVEQAGRLPAPRHKPAAVEAAHPEQPSPDTHASAPAAVTVAG